MAFVYVVVRDLFFAERVENALRQLGHQVKVTDISQEGKADLPAGADLLLVDLEAEEPALSAIEAAHRAGIRVLAFGPHTEVELWQAAKAAGADRVVAKSKLTTAFADLIAQMTQSDRKEGE